jgi:uracil-DNA glycosylase
MHEPDAKRAASDSPHVLSILNAVKAYVPASKHGPIARPDPADGGTGAEVLLLLKSPGSGASEARGSGFVSLDNRDTPAPRLREAVEKAGLARSRLFVWNVVPWPLDEEARGLRVAEIDDALPSLRATLDQLPKLRVVVLLGGATQRAWERFADHDLRAVSLPTEACCSPSARQRPKQHIIDEIATTIRAAMRRLTEPTSKQP